MNRISKYLDSGKAERQVVIRLLKRLMKEFEATVSFYDTKITRKNFDEAYEKIMEEVVKRYN